MNAPAQVRLLIGFGLGKVIIVLVGYPWIHSSGIPGPVNGLLPVATNLVVVLTFWAGAGLLIVGGRRDRRAVILGAFFLSMAAQYGNRLMGGLGEAPFPRGLVLAIDWFPLGAFMPYLLWLFAEQFPRLPQKHQIQRWVHLGVKTALLIALSLMILNIPLGIEWWMPGYQAPDLSKVFGAYEDFNLYPSVNAFSMLLALITLGVKTRWADLRERRRVRLLVASLLIGILPLFLLIFLEVLVPGFREWLLEHPTFLQRISLVAFLPLLSIPFTTAYVVMVYRVMELRLIARKALQYALARYSALTVAVVPLAGLGVYLFDQRSQPLEEIFAGWRAIFLTIAAAVGIYTLRNRHTLLDNVDRRFFREQFDARQILTPLVERIRSTSSRQTLADLVANGINRALHLETIALLVEDRDEGRLKDPSGGVRPLDSSSSLVDLLSGSSQPLDLDWRERPEVLRDLAWEDRNWLLDGPFHMLVPIVAFDGTLAGIIALGEKKSGLPFLREDRQLLSTISHSAALALEVQRLRSDGGMQTRDSQEFGLPTAGAAQECYDCGRLFLSLDTHCPRCEVELHPSLVPFVLPGKFRIERRVGAGGMGVVYRAVDLALSRPVAVKTMRRVSVEDALRLRREARAAAAVYHPNLALIYGVESWQGTPMLIMEFLEGGTLEEQLEERRLEPREAVELGIAMAGALEKLHSTGILHRDLKPSNIGYSRDGTPKLMDFGIARLRADERKERLSSYHPDPLGTPLEEGTDSDATLAWSQLSAESQDSPQRVAGTLHYLSPEALRHGQPNEAFDLWGLAVVLYEALWGKRLFDGTMREVLHAIQNAEVPDLHQRRPDCPLPVAEFFRLALSLYPAERPPNAAAFRRQLQVLRQELLETS